MLNWLRRLLGIQPEGDQERKSPQIEVGDSVQRTTPGDGGSAGAGPPARSRIFCVGIDFGTSGTKMAVRELTDGRRKPVLVDFGTEAPGLVRFSVPSQVLLDGGRLRIGDAAFRATSLGWSPKRLLLHRQAPDSPDLRDVVPSDFSADWRVEPAGSEFLAALFLGHMMRRGRDFVRSLPGGSNAKVVFNVDTPLGELGDPVTARRFQRALDTGLILSETLGSDPSLNEGLSAWMAAMYQMREHPTPEGERLAQLIPEAQAVMQGMGSALQLQSGELYAVLDVGASTTDMGIFRFTRWTTHTTVAFYAAQSAGQGCDALDRWLLQSLQAEGKAQPAATLPEITASRITACIAAGGTHGHSTAKAQISQSRLEEGVRVITREIRAVYSRELFGEAYSKEPSTDKWKSLRTLITGGGSLVPNMAAELRRSPRPSVVRVSEVPLEDWVPVEVRGASERSPVPQELPFLFPALGLSFTKPEMDELHSPNEIIPVDPPDRGPTGIYRFEAEDLYSK